MWPLNAALGSIAEAGITGAELMVTRDPVTQSPVAARALADKEGIEFVALHSPMLILNRLVWGPGFRKIVDRSAQMSKDLGAGMVIIHPPYRIETQYQRWLLTTLNGASTYQGVELAVENMFRVWVKGTPLRMHRWLSPEDLTAFSKVTLDTSHCAVDGHDILEAVQTLNSRIVHVHLSDNQGARRDDHAPPGQGILPLKPFIRQLAQIGFTGAISLEMDLRPAAGDRAKAVKVLKAARKYCEDALG